MHRKLPVYFLLDCSESMIGDGIRSVYEGMQTFLQTLRKDPVCLEKVWVSIITFNYKAQQLVPLEELTDVIIPPLLVSSGTKLGAAFELLRTCIDKEVQVASSTQKGDWRPLVFVITDGQPTDDFSISLSASQSLIHPRVANIYAIGCGEDVDLRQLKDVSDIVLNMQSLNPEGIKNLFVFLTQSVQTASISVEGPPSDAASGINLEKLPPEIRAIDEPPQRRFSDVPRQVFLKCNCSERKLPYLMRYKYEEFGNSYTPIKSHKLDPEFYDPGGSDDDFASISSENLDGCPPCPYCENRGAGVCGECGELFCVGVHTQSSIECPSCNAVLHLDHMGHSSAINIRQSGG